MGDEGEIKYKPAPPPPPLDLHRQDNAPITSQLCPPTRDTLHVCYCLLMHGLIMEKGRRMKGVEVGWVVGEDGADERGEDRVDCG